MLSYGISLLGGILILFFGNGYIFMMPFFVGVARIGISAGFNLIYLINADVFPTLFAASAMGICNLLARIITVMSPQVAELPGATPMVIYSLFCVGGVIVTFFLKMNKE